MRRQGRKNISPDSLYREHLCIYLEGLAMDTFIPPLEPVVVVETRVWKDLSISAAEYLVKPELYKDTSY